MNQVIPDEIHDIMKIVNSAGFEIYIIGGYVRDMIIGVPSKDIDLFTNATGEDIKLLFPNSKVIGNDERQNKILTTIVGRNIELSSYRSNGNRTETGISLERHLATCDLTINAIAMDINKNIIDPHSGCSHITNRIIKCVGNTYDRIEEDKLRIFRAIRFSLRFGFDIDKNLSNIIRKTDIMFLPVERIREEVLKILMYPDGLKKLKDSGLLGRIIPEFNKHYFLKGGNHHNETVDVHMEGAQSIACTLTDNKALVFACALHDIGKSTSFQLKADGDISFHGHEKAGAEIIHDITERFKFSNKDIKYITALVRHHLVNYGENTTDRAYIKRFKALEDAGVSIDDYMIMLYIDHQSNLKNKRIKFGDFISISRILKKYNKLKFSDTPFDIGSLDITGSDIMKLGIPAGPEIGDILDKLFDMVIRGDLDNVYHVLIKHVEWNIASEQ